MKFRNKIAFVLSLPICLGASGTHHKEGLRFYSENVLYRLSGDSSASLDVTIKPIISTTYNLVARFYNNVTNALLFSTSFNDEINSQGKTYTINYPLKYHLNGNGLRFEYALSYGTKTLTWSGLLYPYSEIVINATQYKNTTYTTENRFIKVETGGVITGESFNFDNYNEYLSKNLDNSIDFSSVLINYLHKYEFHYLKAEYHIKDYNNVYPLLRKENNEVVIDMAVSNNDGELSFSINEDLYVKQDTLEMATTKLANYTKTDILYIPIGKQELLEENDSYILLKEAGYSAIDIILPLSFYFNKKIVGQCFDSDYCIEGGIRE